MKIFLLLLLSISAFSRENVCESNVEYLENMRIQTGSFGDKECYISLSPRKIYEMEYRSFLFTTKGRFLVFNSFGSGPSSTHSGAREYNFFKRSSSLNYTVNDEKVIISLVNGDQMSFHKEEVFPESLSNGTLKYNFELDPKNGGGVEISNYSSLILDFGFKMGMSPSWFLSRSSKFIDKYSSSCTITNSEVLFKENSDIHWKYTTDEDIFRFLKKRCPNLTLN
jgi:hypothetical protein